MDGQDTHKPFKRRAGKFRTFFGTHSQVDQNVFSAYNEIDTSAMDEDEKEMSKEGLRNRTRRDEMNLLDVHMWNKIPVECQEILSETHKVNIYAPSVKISKTFKGWVTVLHQLPHFLFWSKIIKKEDNDAKRKPKRKFPKFSFSLKGLYDKLIKGMYQGFLYGYNAYDIKPKHVIFNSMQVIYFEQTGPKDSKSSDKLWIEFSDESEYLRWLRAMMFLLKTTWDTNLGVRDPRRAKENEDDLLMTQNKMYRNIQMIEEPQKWEVWNDIKITFQDRLYKSNGNISFKNASEFMIWDQLEFNLEIRIDNFLASIKDRISILNKATVISFLQELTVREKSARQVKIRKARLDYVNEALNDHILNKRDTDRHSVNYAKLPTFKKFRFTWKQRRVALKAYHAMDTEELDDSVHKACHTLMMKKFEDEEFQNNPCNGAFDILHSQRLAIVHELASLASKKDLKRSVNRRAGKRRAARHMKAKQQWQLPIYDGFNYGPDNRYNSVNPKADKSDIKYVISRETCYCTIF